MSAMLLLPGLIIMHHCAQYLKLAAAANLSVRLLSEQATYAMRSCRCVLAWNEDTNIAVLAFRGTASIANALADIQVSHNAYPHIN